MSKPIKFGILAAGGIAKKMAETLNWMPDAELVAVASRSLERATEFAAAHHIPRAYGSYEELAADPEIEAVYIASPHSHHFEHAMLCLSHGKHILCEKSFTVTEAQAKKVFDLAREKGLFAMEMVWTRFLPAIAKAKALIAEGAIGELTEISCEFGVDRGEDTNPRLHLPELAGGALLDTGIYPLTVASIFFGDGYKKVISSATLSERGVDMRHVNILEYEGGRRAILSAAVNTRTRGNASLYGRKGWLELFRFHGCEKLVLHPEEGEDVVFPFPHDCNGFEYETQEAIDCIRKGLVESEIMPHAQTLRMMHLMDSLRREWGMVLPCESDEYPIA